MKIRFYLIFFVFISALGLSAQDEGEYAEALNNYYQALQIEEDLYDRSIILYNIGLIYSKNGDYLKALKYYVHYF